MSDRECSAGACTPRYIKGGSWEKGLAMPETLGHKRIRLLPEHYAIEDSMWLVTTCTRGRMPTFRNPALATNLMEIIEGRCRRNGSVPWLYCVMPDHLHLVIQIGRTDLPKLMKEIKSLAARAWWSVGGKGALWQASFHDRGIRRTENLDELVRYVMNNPVRGGLADDPSEYPFTGGAILRDQKSPDDNPLPSTRPM